MGAFDGGSATGEGEKLLGEVAGANGGLFGFGDEGGCTGVGMGEEFPDHGKVAEDGGEDVVEVVGDAPGKQAEGFELLGFDLFFLDLALAGEIFDDADSSGRLTARVDEGRGMDAEVKGVGEGGPGGNVVPVEGSGEAVKGVFDAGKNTRVTKVVEVIADKMVGAEGEDACEGGVAAGDHEIIVVAEGADGGLFKEEAVEFVGFAEVDAQFNFGTDVKHDTMNRDEGVIGGTEVAGDVPDPDPMSFPVLESVGQIEAVAGAVGLFDGLMDQGTVFGMNAA